MHHTMGQTVSTPHSHSIPPPLSDDTDDSEEDEALLLDKILNRPHEEKEVSIVFYDEDEEDVDENDLYFDDDQDDALFDFKCFGLPLFSMNFSAVANEENGNNDDEDDDDEDPKENIESLQLQLKVVDAFYNHHTRNAKKKSKVEEEQQQEHTSDKASQEIQESEKVSEHESNTDKPNESLTEKEISTEVVAAEKDEGQQANVDSLRSEPERAEERVSGEEQSQRSSSFINLQQLLFSAPPATDEDEISFVPKNGGSSISSSSVSLFSSSSNGSKSSRIVEIYETRTTQLKPQHQDEREQVPLERRGVPFRKCRDPSCSCHRPLFKSTDTASHRRRHRDQNTGSIEICHPVDNRTKASDLNQYHNGDDSSTVDSPQHKRKSAMLRLQKQRDKLQAMDHCDGDDRTDVSSSYSRYSIRSDCQINTRKNYMLRNDVNNKASRVHRNDFHERQQSKSQVFDDRFTPRGEEFLRDAPPSNGTPTETSEPSPNNNHGQKQQRQQSPPKIPSRRSFGDSSNHKHKTHPLVLQEESNDSRREINSESLETDLSSIPRRCRSEDFIDGSRNGVVVKPSGVNQSLTDRSRVLNKRFQDEENSSGNSNTHAANNIPVREEQEERTESSDDSKGFEFLNSPTCIIEEIHRDGSYPRSRTTQHQHENLLEQLDGIHQQKSESSTPSRKSPAKSVNDGENQNYSRLFAERERSLKEYRHAIQTLLNEERNDRRQKTDSNSTGEIKQHQERGFQRAMKLADLYHNMGLIHYQQGRYETARHVLQCGVDVLIANRASSIPLDVEVYERTTDPFDEDYSNPYFACAPSRLLPLLPTVDEAAPHLSNAALLLAAELILAQGKILAAQGLWRDTKLFSGRVLQWSAFQKQRLDNSCFRYQNQQYATEQHNLYWKEWGPIIARAQVLFARCCEKEFRPDIAMGYYREALSVQQNILSPDHVQAADTLYRMGNLHANSGLLGLAGQCYDDALCLYRRHKNQSHESCLCADEATALAALGWIFLVQNDLERALALTKEALDGMVQVLGSSHRNVLSVQHQLLCVQNALAFQARYEQPRIPVQALPIY